MSLEDRLDELYGTVEKMVGREKCDEWLDQKFPELENLSPNAVIKKFGVEGIRIVSKMIVEKISKGLFAGAF